MESLETRGSLTQRAEPEASQLANQIVSLLERGEKIEAVKLYRLRKGLDLKAAKQAVEQIGEQHGIPASSGVGCLGAMLLGIAVVAGLPFTIQNVRFRPARRKPHPGIGRGQENAGLRIEDDLPQHKSATPLRTRDCHARILHQKGHRSPRMIL